MNFFKIVSLLLLLFCVSAVSARVIQVPEDASKAQAPEDIVDLAEQVAKLFGFEKEFEVAVPKNSTIYTLPQAKFMMPGKNPQTGNPLLLINEFWFRGLSRDQQIFFLGRNFLRLMNGTSPRSIAIIHYLFIIISILLLAFFYFIFGITVLQNYSRVIRFIAAFLLAMACEYLFLDQIENQVQAKLQYQFDLQNIEKVIEITGDKDAAINAIENVNELIAREITAGQTLWKPIVPYYEKLVKALKDDQ